MQVSLVCVLIVCCDVLLCRALHLELPYVDAIKHVLLLGGDTDTNAGGQGT